MSQQSNTTVQQRILALLSDGNYHSREELYRCLSDDLADEAALRVHLTYIRKLLRPRGEDIISEYGSRQYRHVRYVPITD